MTGNGRNEDDQSEGVSERGGAAWQGARDVTVKKSAETEATVKVPGSVTISGCDERF